MLSAVTNKLVAFATNQSWLGALLVRVSVGLMFYQAGSGKLGRLEGVANYFESLGIPAPAFNAVFVAWVETIGGLAIVAGLATRFVAIPLAFTMVVAMKTGGAFSSETVSLMDVLTVADFTYMAALIWLALAGPGQASLDALLGLFRSNKRR